MANLLPDYRGLRVLSVTLAMETFHFEGSPGNKGTSKPALDFRGCVLVRPVSETFI